jgi:lipopolysaccharide heptosyltransferase II
MMGTASAIDGERVQRWRAVRRVLAVRLDNLGDVLMTTPAMAAIRQGATDTHITLLASPVGGALARSLPMLDDVIAFDAPWVKGTGTREPDGIGRDEQRLLGRLAHGRFDAAVIFTVCTQSALPAALLCRLAGIPLRLAHSRENPYDLLTDWVPDTDTVRTGMRHEVARQLALVRSVGWRVRDDRLQMTVTPRQRGRVRALLHAAGVAADQRYLVVHPGASAPSRRYPAARFGRVADEVAARSGCVAVFTGDAAEQSVVDEARRGMTQRSVALAGRLDIGELAALIDGAQLLLANNTGPAHIAAAMGTPVVVLYALTNPQHTPWRVRARVLNHDVPCRHCLKSVCPQGHHDCLLKVSPDDVVDAAMALLRGVEPRAAEQGRVQRADIHLMQGFA